MEKVKATKKKQMATTLVHISGFIDCHMVHVSGVVDCLMQLHLGFFMIWRRRREDRECKLRTMRLLSYKFVLAMQLVIFIFSVHKLRDMIGQLLQDSLKITQYRGHVLNRKWDRDS